MLSFRYRFSLRSLIADYSLAILLVAALALLRIELPSLNHQPLAFWTIVVALAAWNGGFGPGLAATVLAFILGSTIAHAHQTAIDPLEAAIFVAGGVMISTLLSNRRFIADDKREVEYAARAISEGLLSALITCRDDNKISYVNPATSRLFGYTQKELIGKPIGFLMSDERRQQHDAAYTTYQQTGQKTMNWAGAQFDGCNKRGETIRLYMTLVEHWHRGRRFITAIIWKAALVEEYAEELLQDRVPSLDVIHEPADLDPYADVRRRVKELREAAERKG